MIYTYIENYLKSEFTFGFELEGWVAENDNYTRHDFEKFAKKFFTSQSNKNIDISTIKMSNDSSIAPSSEPCDYCNDSGSCELCNGSNSFKR